MAEAGLDGIELECYGHLMDQFMSPLTNELDGPYGGSLENRARFALDVVAAIRKKVGEKLLIGIRYTADETAKGGIDEEEGVAIGHMFKASGQVDFLNVIRGQIHTDPAMTDVIPVQGMKSAPHLDFAGRIRAEVGLPTFHAARIPDVATARHAISSGKLDMIGMTRAHMADPHLVKRSWKAARTISAPVSAPPIASTGSTRPVMRFASTIRPPAVSSPCRTRSRVPRPRSAS
jgi:2,4-dienoyl-CoA reductase-like NADH-dependent reductase (Old Yellow Enzyme family)